MTISMMIHNQTHYTVTLIPCDKLHLHWINDYWEASASGFAAGTSSFYKYTHLAFKSLYYRTPSHFLFPRKCHSNPAAV